MDSYEKHPMGAVRKAYQEGRMEERAKSWTDEDMYNALISSVFSGHNTRRSEEMAWKWIEQYKKSKNGGLV